MLQNCDIRKGGGCTGNATGYDGIHLIYAGGHCHAPSCISMELFNADTGKLLCRHNPVYGKSHEVIFEENNKNGIHSSAFHLRKIVKCYHFF